jgi:hypothetical protein
MYGCEGAYNDDGTTRTVCSERRRLENLQDARLLRGARLRHPLQ